MPADSTNGSARDDTTRLDSWKEIAAYLRRDVKTVQRWERREGLPIHRLQHHALGSVYAYRDELDAWVAARSIASNGHRNGHDANDTAGPADGIGVPIPSGASGAQPGHAQADATPPAGASGKWAMVALTAAVCVLLALAAVPWAGGRARDSGDAAPQTVRFLVGPPPDTVFAGNIVDPEPVISPDGTRLVFRATERDTARQRLYLRRLGQPAADVLPGTDSAVQPFWSPDSRQVAFFAGGELKRLDLSSGQVTSLALAPRPTGGAWLASGDIVFNPGPDAGILRLEAGGGSPVAVTTVNRAARQTRHIAPEPAPDGRGFLYFVEAEDPRQGAVWIGTGVEGRDRPLMRAPRMGRLVFGSWFLFFRGQRLVAQRVDLQSGAPTGEAVELAEALDGPNPNARRQGFSVSASGTLAYWPVTSLPHSRVTWFDRHGRNLGVVGPAGDYPFVSLSPTGDRVVVQRVDERLGAPDLWMHDLATGVATRLTDSPANDEDPVWSPDGRQIAYAKHPVIGAPAQVARLRLDQPSNDADALPAFEGHPTDWSRDGRIIVVQQSGEHTQSDVMAWRWPDASPAPLANSPFNERHGRLSPDGRFLAYSSDETGRFEIVVKALARDAMPLQVSTGGGAHPRWRGDGGELYYISPVGVLHAVEVVTRGGVKLGRPLPLFDMHPALPLPFLDTLYDVTPDGERFLVAAAERPTATAFTVVINGLAALPR